jgi:hypothetical protein
VTIRTISRREILTGAALIVPVAATSILAPSAALANGDPGDNPGVAIAALHQLQARFHASISGGGHIDDLMALWADDATFTVGSTVLPGKDQIRAFFLNSGGFTHNWVSVSPAWKTSFDVHGDTADVYFECHFVDWRATPQTVLTHGTFTGSAKKFAGSWLFWHVTAGSTTLAP